MIIFFFFFFPFPYHCFYYLISTGQRWGVIVSVFFTQSNTKKKKIKNSSTHFLITVKSKRHPISRQAFQHVHKQICVATLRSLDLCLLLFRYSRQIWRQGQGTDLLNVVIPRIISWVSNCYIPTLPDIGRYIASQLLVLLRLVHKHTHTHSLRNDSVVFGQNHINQKENPFGSDLFAQISHRMEKNKGIRSFFASFRHSCGRVVFVVSPSFDFLHPESVIGFCKASPEISEREILSRF